MRIPEMVVVDFPEYAGPAFYDQASRKTWVPIRVQTRTAEGASGASRSQFPLILGWALTVWKAQGMTLRRAIVRLTKCGSAPSVAFTALSRVRHPDHLMLEDSFPDMSTIMKQQDHPSFQARQRWERRAMVKFSRTIRHHMRDPARFTPELCWTAEESRLADTLLARLRERCFRR